MLVFPHTLIILSKTLHLHVQNESDMPLKTQFLVFILNEGESIYFYPIYFDAIDVSCMKFYCLYQLFSDKKNISDPNFLCSLECYQSFRSHYGNLLKMR